MIALAVDCRRPQQLGDLRRPHGSYPALAGSSGAAALREADRVRHDHPPEDQGVAHPVLPCGARLYISYSGKHVLTQVIDRGPSRAEREFELTAALASCSASTGVQRIRWSYAAAA